MELDDESSTGSRTDAEEGPEELLAGASASREVSGETVNPIQNLSAIRQALQDGDVVHQGYKLTDELAPLPLDLLHQTLTHDEVSSYDNDSRLSSQSTAMLRIIVKRRRHLLRNLPPATALVYTHSIEITSERGQPLYKGQKRLVPKVSLLKGFTAAAKNKYPLIRMRKSNPIILPPLPSSSQSDLRAPSLMRVAPAPLYNTFADVQKFYSLLEEAVRTAKD